ncbi:hypothetical protein M758_1G020700 [Ceratodon purpureus]|nr:hypothetical protein M758_1G020700 [Ceratodon purpureus]
MEVQRVCVSVTGFQFLWDLCTYDPFAQGPVVSLVFYLVVWTIIFYVYHRLWVFVQGRHRLEREQELLRDHENRSKIEQENIEQMLSLSTPGDNAAGGTTQNSPVEGVPVLISVDNKSGVDLSGARLSLLDTASLLRVPGEEVTLLQAQAGPVAQTKLTQFTWHRERATSKIQAIEKKLGVRFLLQLGRRQLIYRPSIESTKWKRMELPVNETNQVPAILHSSYSGGTLTVEGVHLTEASIQAATKDKCVNLKTKCNTGSGKLEVFTSESRLPSKDLAEVFVIASKNIISNGDNLRVSSLAVRIQNDNLRTVLLSILPFTILLFIATKQILGSLMRVVEDTKTTSVLAWLLLFIIVVSTLALPRRVDTSITETVKKLAVRTCDTLYLAAQCFIPDKDPEIKLSNMVDEVSKTSMAQSILKYEPSRFQSAKSSRTVPTPTDVDGKDFKDDYAEITETQGFVNNPMWEWPVYDVVYEKFGSHLERRKEKKGMLSPTVPFIVIYRNLKDLPWASQVLVQIFSPLLLEIIKVLLPEKVDQSAICKKKVSLNGPELFRIHETLRNIGQISESKQKASEDEHEAKLSEDEQEAKLSEDEEEASEVPIMNLEQEVLKIFNDGSTSSGERLLHLNHLLRFMSQEFEQVTLMSAAMKSDSKHRVSWEMLWVFFPPKERVTYLDYDTEEYLCGDVLETWYMKKPEPDGSPVFVIKVTKWDYNCKTWKCYFWTIGVPKFEGDCEILNLHIYPLQYTSEPKQIIDGFLKNGKRFCKFSMLERSCFMNYKGSMIRYNVVDSRLVMSKENADGRIMIDLGSFAKMNPDYRSLGWAKPPCEVIRDNVVKTIDITSIKNRMFAPAIVYGFSFHLKKWGSFSVCGISEINFNTSAFDDLVMDADTKEVVENLVRKQLEDGKNIKDSQERGKVDSIASKGEGSIILCYGPPGTGKTLTAESLSEKLQCPLWCLSVSELGITPEILEKTLVQVMNVATSWGALLLLDEADIFIERRTSSDLTRNAMTGIFLRQLEYYRGVLFLTTNRDSSFDAAMCSRISMFLHYERHNEEQRKTIWATVTDRVGFNCTSDEVAELAKPEFNGREIRNIVKTAHTLSRSNDDEEQPGIDHVRKALKVYEASTKIWGRDHQKPAQEST